MGRTEVPNPFPGLKQGLILHDLRLVRSLLTSPFSEAKFKVVKLKFPDATGLSHLIYYWLLCLPVYQNKSPYNMGHALPTGAKATSWETKSMG